MKKLSLSLSSFPIIILFTFSFVYSSETNIAKGKASIIDGDTIKINDEKIRFGGIDTPEKKKIGHEFSKKKLKEKIGNNVVTCFREKKKDPWGRTVAECFVNGESLSAFLVRSGYAFAYRKYSKKFVADEKFAIKNKLGMWSMKFEFPWEFRISK